MKKIAVVLFNLGGPSDEIAVKPFLFNLFNDRAIINLPQPFRFLIAKFISSRREKFAIAEYRKIGGKSSILEETEKQVAALELLLNGSRDKAPRAEHNEEYKIFIGMRYWHPFIESAVSSVSNFCPDEVILLPLYPQFSTTTTASSFNAWKKAILNTPLQNMNTKSIPHYYNNDKFIEAHVKLILPVYRRAIAKDTAGRTRILFSAHGLPKKVILSGDPYQSQIEWTVEAIISKLKKLIGDDIDYSICYQSKVGPMEWLTPDTKSEILRANHDNKAVVIVPIAFVSEHLETLVELDIEYKKIADNIGLPGYFRVQTLRDDPLFMECLADLCRI